MSYVSIGWESCVRGGGCWLENSCAEETKAGIFMEVGELGDRQFCQKRMRGVLGCWK